MDIAAWYRHFARVEAAGSSPSYERLADAVAESPAVLARLATLPPGKQQPNLLFASVSYLGGPLVDPAELVEWVLAGWDALADTMRARSTQTNEAARTGAFLPFLAALPQPLSLIEVGASAGLCLYPDRYAISYDGAPPLVDSPVRIDVRTSGAIAVPTRVPTVVERVGIDLHPLDVTAADDVAWLTACIWPEHEHRRERLRAAAAVVAADPPLMIRGDLVEEIDGALAGLAPDTTPVVLHSAVLAYLGADDRRAFAERLRAHPAVVWLSNEAPGVIVQSPDTLQPPADAPTNARFVLARDGEAALALCDPHGSWLAGP